MSIHKKYKPKTGNSMLHFFNYKFLSYHLAPEYEYPIPLEECYIGTTYFIENLNQYDFNIDRNRIILCGHSAGKI